MNSATAHNLNSSCFCNFISVHIHIGLTLQFRLVDRVLEILPDLMGKSLVIAVRSSTKRNNKTRSCT